MTADIRQCETCLQEFVCTAQGEYECERCIKAGIEILLQKENVSCLSENSFLLWQY